MKTVTHNPKLSRLPQALRERSRAIIDAWTGDPDSELLTAVLKAAGINQKKETTR
jgi:PP-loop superfamily ATP-utilizing enzyme